MAFTCRRLYNGITDFFRDTFFLLIFVFEVKREYSDTLASDFMVLTCEMSSCVLIHLRSDPSQITDANFKQARNNYPIGPRIVRNHSDLRRGTNIPYRVIYILVRD